MNKAALGRLAAAVRVETGCPEHEPFDPWKWSQDNGIPFLSLNDINITTAARDHFTIERPSAWSALLTRYGMQHVVIYNPAHSPERVRSNLAHEVAHFAAEHKLTDAWMDDNGHCGGTSTSEEDEAAELAGALLVPADAARAHAINGGRPEELGAKYGVSIPMARWRMGVSGGAVIAQRARSRPRR